MRTDNYIGLNEWAQEFVSSAKEKFVADYFEGAFYNEFPLYGYTTKDGKSVVEYIQTEPWSSGPNFFIALQIMNKEGQMEPIKKSLWSDEEVRERL